jgi:hypothetical protein
MDPRGSRTQRGYGKAHQQLRNAWQKRLDRGEVVPCWRCGKRINPQSWHLGHDDQRVTRGPECVPCNLGAKRQRNGPSTKRPAERHPGLA